MIVREANNPGRCFAASADAHRARPFVGRDDPARQKQTFRVRSETIHFVHEKIVGEFDALAHSLQPIARLVKKIGQAIARLAGMATIERDKLFCGELQISAQRFEDAENIMLGDLGALAARRRSEARSVFSGGSDFHKSGEIAAGARSRRSAYRAMRRQVKRCVGIRRLKFYHAGRDIRGRSRSGSVALCRDEARSVFWIHLQNFLRQSPRRRRILDQSFEDFEEIENFSFCVESR